MRYFNVPRCYPKHVKFIIERIGLRIADRLHPDHHSRVFIVSVRIIWFENCQQDIQKWSVSLFISLNRSGILLSTSWPQTFTCGLSVGFSALSKFLFSKCRPTSSFVHADCTPNQELVTADKDGRHSAAPEPVQQLDATKNNSESNASASDAVDWTVSLLPWLNSSWPELTPEHGRRRAVRESAIDYPAESARGLAVDPRDPAHQLLQHCTLWSAPSRVSMPQAFASHFTYQVIN